MAKTAMGISITTVSTDAQAPLGFIHIEPASVASPAGSGDTHWIYVKNIGPVALAAGEFASRVTADYGVARGIAAQDHMAVGVCVTPIPINSYGFLLRKGYANVTGGVGAAGDVASPDAAGAMQVLAVQP